MARSCDLPRGRLPKLMILAGMTLALAAQAHADISFSCRHGDLAPRATFAQDGSNLLVTLENLSTDDVQAPEWVLTAVYFDLPGVTLTPVKAVLTEGSRVLFPVDPPDPGFLVNADGEKEVSGEFAFADDITGVPSGAPMVITAVGLNDTEGGWNAFPGIHWTHNPPDGIGYGIVGPTEDGNPYEETNDGNAKVSGKEPLVQGGVLFTLSGLPEGYDVDSNVGGVMWNYGTDFAPMPAPGAAILGMVGLGMVACLRRRLGGPGAKARCGPCQSPAAA